jgi:hypothetical protein
MSEMRQIANFNRYKQIYQRHSLTIINGGKIKAIIEFYSQHGELMKQHKPAIEQHIINMHSL